MSFLLLENGASLLLESGYHLLLERVAALCNTLLLEDGSHLHLQDGENLQLEGPCGCTPYTPIGPALLLQDGFYLLLEDCSHLLLGTGEIPRTAQGYANQRRRLAQINEAMEEEDILLILNLWAKLR